MAAKNLKPRRATEPVLFSNENQIMDSDQLPTALCTMKAKKKKKIAIAFRMLNPIMIILKYGEFLKISNIVYFSSWCHKIM